MTPGSQERSGGLKEQGVMDASLKNRRAGEPGERTRKGQEPDAGAVIKSVAIIGAGQMGNGIAHVVSLAGYGVLMSDVRKEAIDNAVVGDSEEHGAAGFARPDHRGRDAAGPEAHQQCARHGCRRPGRPHHRGGHGGRGGQAQDLRRPAAQSEERRNARQQYFVHLDHPPRLHDRPARAVHRHAFHEPGADDAAGRVDPRHRDRG